MVASGRWIRTLDLRISNELFSSSALVKFNPSEAFINNDPMGATTVSIMTLSKMTFSIMTLSIMTLSIFTFSIRTFIVTTLSIMTLSIF